MQGLGMIWHSRPCFFTAAICTMAFKKQYPAGIHDDNFSELFRYSSAGLLLYAFRFVSIRETAEDIVHNVFVRLWENRENIDYATAKSYLFRSVRNECLDYLKNQKVRTKYEEDIIRKGELSNSLEIDYYVYSELKMHLDNAINQLPRQQRVAFVKNRFEKESFTVIAESMNISPRTVDKHIELALKSLRRNLADYL